MFLSEKYIHLKYIAFYTLDYSKKDYITIYYSDIKMYFSDFSRCEIVFIGSKIQIIRWKRRDIVEKNIYFQIENNDFPKVSITDKAFVRPPYVHFERCSEEYILYYILYGKMYLKEGEKEYLLQKNDFILLDHSRTHKGVRESECEFFYIHFSLHNKRKYKEFDEGIVDFNDRKRQQKITLPKYYHVESSEGLLQCHEKIEKIITTFSSHHIYKEQQVAAYLYEFIILLATEYAKSVHSSKIDIGGKARKVIPELLEYLQQSYAEDISGDLLQEKFHYHFDYLNRQFKKWTGQTIFSYLNKVRIERANQLLVTGFYTISEVAAFTGFRDVYYFSRVFKKLTGNTPGEVRDSNFTIER